MDLVTLEKQTATEYRYWGILNGFKCSVAEFERSPDWLGRYELLYGVLQIMPTPDEDHARIIGHSYSLIMISTAQIAERVEG